MGAGDSTLELNRARFVVDLIWKSGEGSCEGRMVLL